MDTWFWIIVSVWLVGTICAFAYAEYHDNSSDQALFLACTWMVLAPLGLLMWTGQKIGILLKHRFPRS